MARKRPSSVHPELTWRRPRHLKKKNLNLLRRSKRWSLFFFPPSWSFPPLPLPLPLPFLSAPATPSSGSSSFPLSLPLRRASLSLQREISGDPPETESVLFSGDPRPPVLRRPKASRSPVTQTSCSPATQTVIRVFLGFFFGYVADKELL